MDCVAWLSAAVMMTSFEVYDEVSEVEPYMVKGPLSEAMETCSLYVPGSMKMICSFVDEVDKASTAS